MTSLAAETASPPVPTVVPAVISLAVTGVLDRPAVGHVLGTSTHAVWTVIDRSLVVVSTSRAVRLPNSVELASDWRTAGLSSVPASVTVAGGALRLGPLVIRPVRYWDPRPRPGRVDVRALCSRIADLPAVVPGVPATELVEALRSGRADAIVEAVSALLGRGPGLTPEADDYIAGLFGAMTCLVHEVDDVRTGALIEEVRGPILARARSSTTRLSAALLGHAMAGELARPAGRVLLAMNGRGDLVEAMRRLHQVGHTSGAALAAGMTLGASMLVQGGNA